MMSRSAPAPPQRRFSQLATILAEELVEEKQNCFAPDEFEDLKASVERAFPVIEDTPGIKDVVLRRSANGEEWVVKFNIDDLMNSSMDDFEDQLDANGNPMIEGRSADGEEEEEDLVGALNFTVTVTKGGNNGGLRFDLIAGDPLMEEPSETPRMITIDKIVYYNTAEDMAQADTAPSRPGETSTGTRTGVAPQFDELAEELQESFYGYLEQNGITNEFAEFLMMYADLKEQKEYVGWLDGIATFVKK